MQHSVMVAVLVSLSICIRLVYELFESIWMEEKLFSLFCVCISVDHYSMFKIKLIELI